MVWKKTLIPMLVVLGMSCESIRTIPFCTIDLIDQVCNCSVDGDDYVKPIEHCAGWKSTSDAGWQKIAEKLSECENRP